MDCQSVRLRHLDVLEHLLVAIENVTADGRPCRRAIAALEYVEHFCGLECYQRFQARASTATET
ncbi:DUF3330 domain-containing protein, partial [Burkholderia multivorans]|uniref:DUF3330 domain-containing protein n=1 Tax=Burkholderia multivorans TaxID=87883 RepID=UPI0040452D64